VWDPGDPFGDDPLGGDVATGGPEAEWLAGTSWRAALDLPLHVAPDPFDDAGHAGISSSDPFHSTDDVLDTGIHHLTTDAFDSDPTEPPTWEVDP